MKKDSWIFSDGAQDRFPGGDPMAAFVSPELVKKNAVREVWKTRDFFFKFDKRPGRTFLEEFRHGSALADRGVPVVAHLACGHAPQGACLVTAALRNAVPVEEFIAGKAPPDAFLDAVAGFLKLLDQKKIVHRDLHPGNVLVVPEKNILSLVDVRDAFPAGFFSSLLFSRTPFLRFIADLAENLPDGRVCDLLRQMGLFRPRTFLYAEFRRKALFVRREWPRRKAQILSGYPKFTRAEGDLLFVRNADGSDLARAATVPAGEDVFTDAFFLDLVRLPHRRVFAWDRKKEILYLEPVSSAPPPPDRVRELARRAALAGVSAPPELWCTGPDGLVKLSEWKGVTLS